MSYYLSDPKNQLIHMDTTNLSLIYSIAIAFGILIYLAIAIPFALTFRNALRAVSIENREMRPEQAWLLLIPILNIYWTFIVNSKLSSSFQKDFRDRGFALDNRPTYRIGLSYGILTALSYLPSNIIPFVSISTFLPALICWIFYWVKVAEYKKRLLQLPAKHEDSLIFGHVHQ
jgi:hypothetical protein